MDGKMVDEHRAHFTLGYDGKETTPEEIVHAFEKSQPHLQAHPGKPEEVPPPSYDVDYRTISMGGSFEIEKNLRKGKTTLFLFYFDTDEASKDLSNRIDAMAKRHKDIAIRTVLLGSPDWSDNAARQVERDFGVKEAPYVRVYGKDGKLKREVKGDKPEEVEAAIK